MQRADLNDFTRSFSSHDGASTEEKASAPISPGTERPKASDPMVPAPRSAPPAFRLAYGSYLNVQDGNLYRILDSANFSEAGHYVSTPRRVVRAEGNEKITTEPSKQKECEDYFPRKGEAIFTLLRKGNPKTGEKKYVPKEEDPYIPSD